MPKEQNRGRGAKKVELERRLDSNSDKVKQGLAEAAVEKSGETERQTELAGKNKKRS